MRKCISLLITITMLFLFASCKAEKEALSLTGETQLAPANKNEPVVADVPIEETKIGASTTDGKTAEQSTNKEIDVIVSRVIDELKNTTALQTEATTAPEPFEVAVCEQMKYGEYDITFTKVKLFPDRGGAYFYFTINENGSLAIDTAICKGVSGAVYKGGGGIIRGTGDFAVFGIKDFSDLSTVTLTFQIDALDPVTVTFNIPV